MHVVLCVSIVCRHFKKSNNINMMATVQEQSTALPRGTTYLGCREGPDLPGGASVWKSYGPVQNAAECVERASKERHGAVALKGYDAACGCP